MACGHTRAQAASDDMVASTGKQFSTQSGAAFWAYVRKSAGVALLPGARCGLGAQYGAGLGS